MALKCKLLLLIFFLFLINNCSTIEYSNSKNKHGGIAGSVCDPGTGSAIKNANVIITENNKGAATNQYGTFLISDIPAGSYNLRATVIGYHELIIKNISVVSDSITILRFNMTPSVLTVVVHPLIWTKTDTSIFSIKKFYKTEKINKLSCTQ